MKKVSESLSHAQASRRISELRRQIEYHEKKYYVENNPQISDFEFDELVRELAPHIPRQGRHVPEAGRPLAVDPLEHLRGPVAGLAPFLEPGGQLFLREVVDALH